MQRAIDPHCRIGKIRLKPNRYRAAGIFNVRLNELREAVARRRLLKSVRA